MTWERFLLVPRPQHGPGKDWDENMQVEKELFLWAFMSTEGGMWKEEIHVIIGGPLQSCEWVIVVSRLA